MLQITARRARESPARGIVEGLSDFGVEVYGWDPLLTRDEIEGFGVKALDFLLAQVFFFLKRKSVLTCEGCLMKKKQKGKGFIVGGCDSNL